MRDTTVLDAIPQGSWAHQTIIQPGDGLEFDADFLLQIDGVSGWAPTAGVADSLTAWQDILGTAVEAPTTTASASLPVVKNVATNRYIARDQRATGEQFIDDLITFRVVGTDVPKPYEIRWKVRNRGVEAKRGSCERGSIFVGGDQHVEPTSFKGPTTSSATSSRMVSASPQRTCR